MDLKSDNFLTPEGVCSVTGASAAARDCSAALCRRCFHHSYTMGRTLTTMIRMTTFSNASARWNSADEITCGGHRQYPPNPTKDVVESELRVLHLGNARNERGKGPHDRHESRQHNRFSTMLFIEGFGLQEMFLLHKWQPAFFENVRAN